MGYLTALASASDFSGERGSWEPELVWMLWARGAMVARTATPAAVQWLSAGAYNASKYQERLLFT
jgi:hypothetical protein